MADGIDSGNIDTPYADLSPDAILDALEAVGFSPSGGLLELNSYENRVYQIELDDGGFVVSKFYRPGRWSDPQIRERIANLKLDIHIQRALKLSNAAIIANGNASGSVIVTIAPTPEEPPSCAGAGVATANRVTANAEELHLMVLILTGVAHRLRYLKITIS